jgi:hypothetical protein
MAKKVNVSSLLSGLNKGDLSGFNGFENPSTAKGTTNHSLSIVNDSVKCPVKVLGTSVSDTVSFLESESSISDSVFISKFLDICKPSNLSTHEKREVLDILLYQYIVASGFVNNRSVMLSFFGDLGYCVEDGKHSKLQSVLTDFTFSIKDKVEDGYVSFNALCKIFEMFIPSDADDDEGDVKKATGSVYTPKDITYFMSVDAVVSYLRGFSFPLTLDEDIYYLLASDPYTPESVEYTSDSVSEFVKTLKEIDLKLSSIRVLEPSVGAGAFVHSMLVVLTNIRKGIANLVGRIEEIPKSSDFYNKYDEDLLKSYILKNNLYGVDINKDAIDMTCKRLLISYLSSFEVNSEVELPNLDLNFMVGNSLLDRENGKKLITDQLNFKGKDIQELAELRSHFKTIAYEDKSSALQNVVGKFKEIILTQGLLSADIRSMVNSIATFNDFQEFSKLLFSYSLVFSDLVMLESGDGFEMKEVLFDIVIGNPPYVRASKIVNGKDDLKVIFQSYHGAADLLVYFYEQGYNLLKANGILSYITSNKWLTSKYGEPLRAFIQEKSELLLVMDFKDNKVFKGTGVDTEITVFRKPRFDFGVPNISGGSNFLYCSGETYTLVE